MTGQARAIFVTLDPPPGGPAGLRSRLARERTRPARLRRWRLAAASLALVTAGAVAAAVFRADPAPLPPEFDLMRMTLGQLSPPSEPVTVWPAARGRTALQRVPTRTDTVVLYLVASVSESSPD